MEHFLSEVQLKSLEKSLEDIHREFEKTIKERDEYMEKAAEVDRSTEIAELKEQLWDLRRHALTVFSDKELAAERNFIDEHYKRHNCHLNRNLGNTWIYTITQTGIGVVTNIKCPICGEEQDITDTEAW